MAPATRRASDVTISSAGYTLAGTVVLPGSAAGGTDQAGGVDQPFPAALILPGSGPIDRDGDHKRLPLGVSRALAEALADHGIASLRYDKRGTGSSEGEFLPTGLLDKIDKVSLRRRAAELALAEGLALPTG